MNYDTLISFVLATSFLAISPGPDNIYVLIQSITNGKKFGLATVVGLISGCLVHTTLVAFGISVILKENKTLFLGIKLLGAIYLLFLAYQVFKSDSKIVWTDGAPKKSITQLFKQGFIMNVLNPKVSLFFLAFFPGFLFSNTLNTVTQFYVLGVLFMLVSLIIFSAIAVLSGSISKYLKESTNVSLVLKWLQIIVFIAIAVFILI